MAPIEYTQVDLTDDDLAREREVYGGLAASTRAFAEASLRTTVDEATVEDVRRQLDALTERLRASEIERSFGVSVTTHGVVRAHGNAVVGLRNPVAVPLDVQRDASGRAGAAFHLGALYEGPPGMVHGGVAALVLDQLLGEAAAAGGSPGMTGRLTLTYRRPTPLGDCSAEAWVEQVDGIKTTVRGVLRPADGETSVEAEGLFILPRWAREAMERDQAHGRPIRFE
jgi:acyl-coenzyme A thioesterase PaaI-like protein